MKEMQGRNLPLPDRLHKFLPKGLILLSFLAISFYLGGIFCSDKGSLALNGANDVNGQICIPQPTITKFEQCNITMQDYTPCTDPTRWSKFDKRRMAFRERHCPPPSERVHCTIPPPAGYKPPIKWPRSRDECWYSNVPYDWINTQKANQRWMVKKGEKFIFPGGGTMFPKGVNGYLDQMEEVIPGMKDGTVRTALDTGCGVASWGGNLLDRGILTMSLAPRDNHEAQVEFALERGIPAMIGIIATQRLPYPASAFDMAHCSRCLIPWTDSDGISLLEVDRVLRPGGFWVLSGPPVNYEKHWTGWDTTAEAERSKLEALQELLSRMCYSLYKMEGDIAVWQKPLNNSCYVEREEEIIPMCDDSQEADDSWYVPMRPCIVKQKQNFKLLGVGQTPKWPERLTKPPERVHLLPGGSSGVFKKDTSLWEDRVKHYKSVLPQLGSNTVRNVMDMNTQYGGFAAALINDPVWVMNVVSSYAANSLGVIFDRGLIGTTHDWCEAFSTYPRTYDFLHLDGLFTTESHRCEMKLVLLEMDRILRPTGYVMMRDTPSFLDIASSLGKAMHWQCKKHPTENPNNENEALLICQKELWQSSSGATTVKEEDD